MDIKPFVYELTWSDATPALITCLVIIVVTLLGSYVLTKKLGANFIALVLMIVGIFSGPVAALSILFDANHSAYEKRISALKDSLDEGGFSFISGKIDLKPNSQSPMLLQYEGKNFDCTMFAPEDVNKTVVFSCGEAKLSLEDVKKTVEK